MFGLMFAMARMATAAWVGAAVLFVVVGITQVQYLKSSSVEAVLRVDDSEPAAEAPATESKPDGSTPAQEEAGVAGNASSPALASQNRPTAPADGKAPEMAKLPNSDPASTEPSEPKSVQSGTTRADAEPNEAYRMQKLKLVAMLTQQRFVYYYWTGGILLGLSWWWCCLPLGRRYLKHSRWLLVMFLLSGACATFAYDAYLVYRPLNSRTQQAIENPSILLAADFITDHEHSRQVNAFELILTALASLFLSLPGTRPDRPTVVVKAAN